MTRFNWKLFGLTVILLGILTLGYLSYPGEERTGDSHVLVIIDFGEDGQLYRSNLTMWEGGEMVSTQVRTDNATRFEFHGIRGENQTVLDVLQKAGVWGNFSIDYSGHKTQKGVFVDSIAEVENGDHSWQYYLNDEYGVLASDRKSVRDGDRVLWVYE